LGVEETEMIRHFFILVVLGLYGSSCFSHGGGLDANGCHNDRKRGGYHCHGSRSTSRSSPSYSTRSPSPSYSTRSRSRPSRITYSYPKKNKSKPTKKPTIAAPVKDNTEAQLILKVQSMLSKKGYMGYLFTGRMDQNTLEALKKFQSDEGLEATGKLDKKTLGKLGI